MYKTEQIPDADSLFLRVHKSSSSPDGSVIHRAFEEHGGGMSTNWAKHSTPEETRDQVALSGKEPKNYGVISFIVGEVRAIPETIVRHTPIFPENRSHTDVSGPGERPVKPATLAVFQTDVRRRLAKIYKWVLRPDSSPE